MAYGSGSGTLRELDESRINQGALGGLVAFRNDSLDSAQNSLDQIAHTLATRVNEVHAQGVEQSGDAGGQFFTTTEPRVASAAGNVGNAELDVQFNDGESGKLAASVYRVEYKNDGATVTRLADGQQTNFDDNTFDLDGLSFSLAGNPEQGDAFTVRPLAGAAANLEVAIDDPSAIAASKKHTNDDGEVVGKAGDNRNAVALADLRDEPAVGGNRNFNDSYAELVSRVGNSTATLRNDSDAQSALTGKLERAQQSVSGVNLDEERVDLLYYQQMYQANARVIDTASTMFDTLLGLGR